MSKEETVTIQVPSVAAQHQLLGFARLKQPLFSILRFEDVPQRLLSKVELLLSQHFAEKEGLPTVGFLATQLHLSPKYLSDCLKQLTGQTAQQLIQDKLLTHAKHVLATTSLTVSEIAYRLGFEYPQSFNKLFKNKTNQTPLAYRQSFN